MYQWTDQQAQEYIEAPYKSLGETSKQKPGKTREAIPIPNRGGGGLDLHKPSKLLKEFPTWGEARFWVRKSPLN